MTYNLVLDEEELAFLLVMVALHPTSPQELRGKIATLVGDMAEDLKTSEKGKR